METGIVFDSEFMCPEISQQRFWYAAHHRTKLSFVATLYFNTSFSDGYSAA